MMNFPNSFKQRLHISKGVSINGNISTEDSGCIQGVINGDVISSAQIIIEKTGIVNGNIHAKSVIIKGIIKGNVHCPGKVYLLKNGEVHGHIYANEVSINKESKLKGGLAQLHHNTSSAEIIAEQKETAEEIIASALADKPRTDDVPQNWF
ncbi:MAG: polymer-forming cytoskeletal protein [Parafilimonas sp.]|nr:polymer-forming cytoskeletal protein [Parafilimonas sp.]